MHTHLVPAFALSALMAAAFSAQAQEPSPMAKGDVLKVLNGKTMKFRRADGQYVSWTFRDGGYFNMRTPDGSGSGTWKVQDNGQFCVDLRGPGAASGCRALYKTDTGYSYGTTDTGEKRAIESIE